MNTFKNNKSLRLNMIKKLSVFLLLFLSLIMSGYSANHTIQQCPTTWISGDTYIIDNTFVGNTCNLNGNNTIITSNNMDTGKSITFTVSGYGNVIQDFKARDISVILPNNNQNIDFTVKNSDFHNMSTPFINYGGNFFFNFNYGGLSLLNNTFTTKTNTNFFNYFYSGINDFPFTNANFYNTVINDNDFIGFNYFTKGTHGNLFFQTNNTINNNNFIIKNLNFGTNGLNSCDLIFTNNYLGFINGIDTNLDYINDNLVTLSYSACNYYSGFPQIKANLKKLNTQSYSYLANSPNYYESNKNIYVPTAKTLDGLNTGIDFTNVFNTYLDLSLLPGQDALILNGIKAIKLGNNNGILGGNNTKPIVRVGQYIPATYTSDYSSNYHLIEYSNSATIDNINFLLNFGETSLLRKQSLNSDGVNLKFKNNNVDLKFVPVTTTQPLLVIGCKAQITGNSFNMFNIENQTIFSDGRCLGGVSGVSGGHLIQNNTFQRGGIALRGLTYVSGPGVINLASKFNYNSFLKGVGIYYSKPIGAFHMNIVLPEINSSYYSKSTCQNYEYNIGNYYQSVFDNALALGLTDNNGDGIYDQALSFGQTDINNNPIFDYRALTSYSYDFAGQIANSVSTTNTCGSLSFNILNPVQNNIYSSTNSFSSNWEYTSSTYTNLYCKENFNGIESYFNNVNSGVNKGMAYSISDGTGTFQVSCSDTETFDNLVFSSQIINFQIGSLTTPIVVNPNPIVITPNTTTVYGCTDNTATNYNPLANTDDGSCIGGSGGGGTINTTTPYSSIDVIDYNSVDNTNQNTIGFLQDVMSFITNVGIPLGILVVVIVSVLAVLRLLI